MGLTQGDLAAAAQIADETVSRIERGRLNPSIAMAGKIAEALDTTVNDLLHAKTPPKEPRLRASEAKLLALVRRMNDTEVEDVVRALKLLLSVGERAE